MTVSSPALCLGHQSPWDSRCSVTTVGEVGAVPYLGPLVRAASAAEVEEAAAGVMAVAVGEVAVVEVAAVGGGCRGSPAEVVAVEGGGQLSSLASCAPSANNGSNRRGHSRQQLYGPTLST